MLYPELGILWTADGAPIPFDRDHLTRATSLIVGCQPSFAIGPIEAAVMRELHSGFSQRNEPQRSARRAPSRVPSPLVGWGRAMQDFR